jgi:hypothetical protein
MNVLYREASMARVRVFERHASVGFEKIRRIRAALPPDTRPKVACDYLCAEGGQGPGYTEVVIEPGCTYVDALIRAVCVCGLDMYVIRAAEFAPGGKRLRELTIREALEGIGSVRPETADALLARCAVLSIRTLGELETRQRAELEGDVCCASRIAALADELLRARGMELLRI